MDGHHEGADDYEFGDDYDESVEEIGSMDLSLSSVNDVS